MKDNKLNSLNTENLTNDLRTHVFHVGIARDFSVPISLFLGHLSFWAEKNLANNKNIHDGLVWCYDTLEAISDYFPYYSIRQIETMINNCVEAGLCKKGNYNHNQYDRTVWYALTPEAYFYFPHLLNEKYLKRLYLSISQKCEMDFTEWGNRFHQNVTTIPDTTPDPDPDIIYIGSLFEKFWSLYPKKKSKKACIYKWKSLKSVELYEYIIDILQIQIRFDVQWREGFSPSALNYLTDERWNDEIMYQQGGVTYSVPADKFIQTSNETEERIKNQEKHSINKAKEFLGIYNTIQ